MLKHVYTLENDQAEEIPWKSKTFHGLHHWQIAEVSWHWNPTLDKAGLQGNINHYSSTEASTKNQLSMLQLSLELPFFSILPFWRSFHLLLLYLSPMLISDFVYWWYLVDWICLFEWIFALLLLIFWRISHSVLRKSKPTK